MTLPSHPVLIIGAGPAGLSAAYELLRRGMQPLILEKGSDAGASFRAFPKNIFFGPWLNNLLPGSSIDWAWLLKRSTQPAYSKYLSDYAHRNQIPMRCGVSVNSVRHDGTYFHLDTSDGPMTCSVLVNATGYFSKPFTPDYPGLEQTHIQHMHVSSYREPASVIGRLGQNHGKVLVVGKRLSAGETMVELQQAGFQVALSYRDKLSFGPSALAEAFISPFQWIVERINVALRRKLDSFPKMAGGLAKSLIRSGKIATYPNIAAFEDDMVRFEDGRREQFDLVIFATGYRAALDHLRPCLEAGDGEPEMRGMESVRQPNLFFLGLDQQRTFRSRFLRGIVEDSRFLAELVARRARRLPRPSREPQVEVRPPAELQFSISEN